MNTKQLSLFSLLIFAVLGAACATPQTSSTTNANNSNATSNMTSNANAMNHNAMNHNAINHAGMNHAGMNHANMESSPNAASQPYDLQFLDTMIAHHQGAVDMAKPALEQASRAELKAFAQSIIRDQEKEINQMKQWRESWYAGKPEAINMDMAGMRDSMKGMDMQALGNARGNAYDVMFVEQMIPHHEGAVVMSNEALAKAEHAELKTLARQIIQSQEREVTQMKQWLKTWQK